MAAAFTGARAASVTEVVRRGPPGTAGTASSPERGGVPGVVSDTSRSTHAAATGGTAHLLIDERSTPEPVLFLLDGAGASPGLGRVRPARSGNAAAAIARCRCHRPSTRARRRTAARRQGRCGLTLGHDAADGQVWPEPSR